MMKKFMRLIINIIIERHNNAVIIIKALLYISDDNENNLNRNVDKFYFMSNNFKILSK